MIYLLLDYLILIHRMTFKLTAEYFLYNKIYHFKNQHTISNMNDNQEMLLIDEPPNIQQAYYKTLEDEDLLLDGTEEKNCNTDQEFALTEKLIKTTYETWSTTSPWVKQTDFILQQESSSEDEAGPIFSPEKHCSDAETPRSKRQNFPYLSLMKKLELAFKLIQQKQKSKTKLLFSSARYTKSRSSQNNIELKRQKTQRTSKEEAAEEEKKKNNWKKYTAMRKSTTEPNQNIAVREKFKPSCIKTPKYDPKSITEVDEKESPLLKGRKEGERQRRKQEFLTSMTNWQEQRKLRQLQLMHRQQLMSMNGVTFTPTINAKSKLLMKKKGNILPIYQRETKTKKVQVQLGQKSMFKSKK